MPTLNDYEEIDEVNYFDYPVRCYECNSLFLHIWVKEREGHPFFTSFFYLYCDTCDRFYCYGTRERLFESTNPNGFCRRIIANQGFKRLV